jgi:hypothetical protein
VPLKVVVGASDDAELARFVEGWAAQHQSDPRRAMGAGTDAGSSPGSSDQAAAS